jgi:hypothetical protein
MDALHVTFQAPAAAGDDSRQASYLIVPDRDGSGVVAKPLEEIRCRDWAEVIRILQGMHPGLGMQVRKLTGAGPMGPSDIA